MKNEKKKEVLYNALSKIDEGNTADFLRYEKTLDEKEVKAVKFRPVLGVIGAFALFFAVCGLTYGGLKYLEYRGELIINQPAESVTEKDTETPADDNETAPFRIVKEHRYVSGIKLETLYEYDEHGRLSKETAKQQYGRKEVTEYTYGNRGNLIKKYTELLKPNGNGKIWTETVVYSYNDGKHLSSISSTKTEKDGATDQTTKTETKYGYNENWQIVRYEYDHCTTSGGTTVKMHYYTDYTFTDENGSYTYIQKSDSGEITTGQVTLDKFGNVIKSETKINGETTVMENEYDEHGKLTKNSRDGNIITECSYTYNGDVPVREDITLHTVDGVQKTYNEYKYDENGNVIESASYTKDGNLISKTTYEYEPTP